MDLIYRLSRVLADCCPSFYSKNSRQTVFIIGAGRSGTTILNDLLSLHPDISMYPYEANELWHPDLYPYIRSKRGVTPIWIDPKKFTESSLMTFNSKRQRHLVSRFNVYAKLKSRPIFINKTVMVNFMLDKVREIFPNCRFVHVVRNGIPVSLSLQIKEQKKLHHPRYSKYDAYYACSKICREWMARYWNSTILEVESFRQRNKLGNESFFELRYEDMVTEPARYLGELFNFLKVPVLNSAEFLLKIQSLEDKNYKSREQLTNSEIASLKAIMNEGLRLKGYL